MRALVVAWCLALVACVNGPLLPAPQSPTSPIEVTPEPAPTLRPSHAALGGIPGGGFIPPTRISTGGGTGDITSVTAGNGLTGGGLSGDVTLDVGAGNGISVGTDSIAVLNGAGLIFSGSNLTYDPTVIQSRIAGACGVGSAIRAVNSDGTVTCQTAGTGTVTSVGTGTGLTGGPITSSGTVSLANTTVTPGTYTYPSITVDQQGRLTAASSGTTPITGPLTNGDLVRATGTSTAGAYPGSTPVACTAGSVTTQPTLSAAGAVTNNCSTLASVASSSGGGSTTNFLRGDGTWAAPPTGITGTLTTGKVPVATGTNALGDSIISVTPSAVSINNSAASYQLELLDGSSGSLSLVDANATPALGFNAHFNGAAWVADSTSIADLVATGVSFRFQKGSGCTIGSTCTTSDILTINTSGSPILKVTGDTETTGNLTVDTNATVDGNTTLGNASTDTTTVEGHLHGAATTPTVTACGGGGSVAGSDIGGIITTSSAATSCTLNFGATWSNTPACIFEMASNNSTAAIFITAQSTSAVTFTFPNGLGTAQTVNYVCVGH